MKSQPTVLPGSGGSGGPSIFTAAPPFDSGGSLPPFVVLAFCLFSPPGHSWPEKNLWTASRVSFWPAVSPFIKSNDFFSLLRCPLQDALRQLSLCFRIKASVGNAFIWHWGTQKGLLVVKGHLGFWIRALATLVPGCSAASLAEGTGAVDTHWGMTLSASKKLPADSGLEQSSPPLHHTAGHPSLLVATSSLTTGQAKPLLISLFW